MHNNQLTSGGRWGSPWTLHTFLTRHIHTDIELPINLHVYGLWEETEHTNSTLDLSVMGQC